MVRRIGKTEAPRTPEAAFEKTRQLASRSLWLTAFGGALWALAPFPREVSVSRILLVVSAAFLLIMIEHALDWATTAIADSLGVPQSSTPNSVGKNAARQISIGLAGGLAAAAILIIGSIEGPHWGVTAPLAIILGAALLASRYFNAPARLQAGLGPVLGYACWYIVAADITREAAVVGRNVVLGGAAVTLIVMVRLVRAAGAVRRRSTV